MKNSENYEYAEQMLLKVSRTFALNINVLRGSLHQAVLLAYLYMRIADTIEDDAILSASEKNRLLTLFSSVFEKNAKVEEKLFSFVNALPPHWINSNRADEELSLQAFRTVPLIKNLPEMFALPIAETVREMCKGMGKFALRQEASLEHGWFTLEKVSDLDEYCYYVAGIVGKFLTHVFYAACPGISRETYQKMQQLDVSFGLALQVTNIVKDVLEDAERSVCFIPEEICRKHGFQHSNELFGEKANPAERAAVLAELVQKAWSHVRDGVEYTLLIPRRYCRVRLFCLWPLLMAAENLRLIGDGRAVFETTGKVKISRNTVKKILKQTTLHFYSNRWIRKTFEDLSK